MSEDATGIIVGGCRLERQIGRGGAGTVYRATQLGVNRAVAVKLIPTGDDGLGGTARFEREAQAAGALDHPNCLPVYAAGEQDGLLYLVMRLVEGADLAEIVQRHGPLEPERAVALITQVASAIDYAHRVGMVHRDLKPANILIEPDGGVGHAFVSDFGLMRSLADPDPITQAGQWVGTPQYAAPEQQRGETVGPAADIYALGRVLAYAVGTRPPAPLADVITRALSEDPHDRYATAGELAAEARAALDRSAPPHGADAPTRAVPPPTLATQTLARPQPTAPTRRSAPSRGGHSRRSAVGPVLVIVGALVLAAAGVIVALSLHHNSTTSTGADATTPTTGTAGTGTRTRTTPAGARLSASSFTVSLPPGWVVLSTDTAMSNFHRSVVQNRTGSITADIDRGSDSSQSLSAHAAGVRDATARTTSGYSLTSFTSTTLIGDAAVIWGFAIAGQPDGEHVDVFRQIGSQYFAVLTSSNAQAASRTAALAIARGIRTR